MLIMVMAEFMGVVYVLYRATREGRYLAENSLCYELRCARVAEIDIVVVYLYTLSTSKIDLAGASGCKMASYARDFKTVIEIWHDIRHTCCLSLAILRSSLVSDQ